MAGVASPPGCCGRGQCPVGGHRVLCGRLQPDQRPGRGQGQVLEPPRHRRPVGPGDVCPPQHLWRSLSHYRCLKWAPGATCQEPWSWTGSSSWRGATIQNHTSMRERESFYVMCHAECRFLSSVEVLDDVTKQWYSLPPLTHPRAGLGLVGVGGRLFAAGGWADHQYSR